MVSKQRKGKKILFIWGSLQKLQKGGSQRMNRNIVSGKGKKYLQWKSQASEKNAFQWWCFNYLMGTARNEA